MTQAQDEAHVCGMLPEHHDVKFVAQHQAAYAFAARVAAGKRVLEIGFGEGYGADLLAQTAASVTAIDTAPGNIPRAQAKYQRPNLRFLHMPGQRMDFPDGAFEVAGSFQVIEHIPEAQLLPHLREVARVLAPGGCYCLSTLNLAHAMKPGQPYQKLIYHEKEFTGPELRALLAQAFPRVELSGLYLSPRHRLFQRLKKWGLDRWGPAALNPVARLYRCVTVEDLVVKSAVSNAALDLFAVAWK